MGGAGAKSLIIGGLAVLLGACETLPGSSPGAITAALPLQGASMPDGVADPTPPPGFISFCMRFEDQCFWPASEPEKLQLDQATWSEIVAVNSNVNAAIWPVEDTRHYGRAEYWTIPTDGYGDCDDYALTKRKALADAGLPLRALRIALAVTGRNNRHAVLTVATDRGDFVLDNETDDILPWDKTGYRWIARQDAMNDKGWVALLGSPERFATAATEHHESAGAVPAGHF